MFVAYIQMQEIFCQKNVKTFDRNKSFRLSYHLLNGNEIMIVWFYVTSLSCARMFDFQQQKCRQRQAATAAPASPAVGRSKRQS